MVIIGKEMLDRYKQRKQLPSVIEIDQRDNEHTQRIKRIIKYMTDFRSEDRKNIREVEEEYQGMH